MLVKVKALRRVVLDRVINAGDVVDMHVALARMFYVTGDVEEYTETLEQDSTPRRGRPRKED